MSILPIETAHYNDPIRDRYLWILYSSRSSVVLSSGRSPSSSGDLYFDKGLFSKIVVYPSIIFSIYLFGGIHIISSSSLKKSQPKWYDILPIPFSLYFQISSRRVMIDFGSCTPNAICSKLTPPYNFIVCPSYIFPLVG